MAGSRVTPVRLLDSDDARLAGAGVLRRTAGVLPVSVLGVMGLLAFVGATLVGAGPLDRQLKRLHSYLAGRRATAAPVEGVLP